MKKVFKGVVLVCLIVLLAILVIFSKKTNLMSQIKNVGESVVKKEVAESEVTKVDVTDLDDNGRIEHEHVMKTMYDENQHWEECSVCGEKQRIEDHTCTRTWALGSESCYFTNSYIDVCNCGYSYTGHKPCVWNGSSYIGWSDRNHDKKCSVCNYCIRHPYYWNNKLYDYNGYEDCYTSGGVRLDCFHSGQCYICKTSRAVGEHRINRNGNDELKCIVCGAVYGKVTNEIVTTDGAQVCPTYTVDATISLMNGAKYDSIGSMSGNIEAFDIKTVQLLNKSSETQFTIRSTVRTKSTIKSYNWLQPTFWVTIGGKRMYVNLIKQKISPDLVSPVISSVAMDNSEELVDWSRTKPIVVTGTENYCNIVNVKIEDELGNVIFNGSGNVTNGSFSVSCTPEIECDTNGKNFKVTVTDTCENSTEQEFTIAKVDSIAPEPTSGEEILGDWAKSKNFTFSAVDRGIGGVSIAFNDIEDLSLASFDGENYFRDYEFVGDVYSPKELSVLYKDELGNTSMQKITIDKLDNTAPTIVSASVHNNKINVVANDEKEGMGEGSGIVKYRYFASSEKLENPEVSSGIEINESSEIIVDKIYEVKYVYIVAEDLVGNVSSVFEVKVPELILTSTVDLNLANGKGGIVLDWSGYEILDKYFVIYRKCEGDSEFEKIVGLEDKFCSQAYVDESGNDKEVPDSPTIKFSGETGQNNIKVDASSKDNGTKYVYYVEAYDSNDIDILLSKSNVVIE